MPLPELLGNAPKVMIEEGNYPAALIRIYHIGKFESTFLDESGNKKDPQDKIILGYEVDCRIEGTDDNHCVHTNELTYSIAERSNLGKSMREWLGPLFNPQKFRLMDMLDRDCKIYLTHETSKKGKLFVSIDKIKPATKTFRPTMDSFCWSITDDPQLIDQRVPKWIKDKAKGSIEGLAAGHKVGTADSSAQAKLDKDMADKFGATRVSGHAVNHDDDDAPF